MTSNHLCVTASSISPRHRRHQGEVNGRWVIEADSCPFGLHGDGTLVSDPAPPGTDESLTFTASNGKRYWDTEEGSQWTPRNGDTVTRDTGADLNRDGGTEMKTIKIAEAEGPALDWLVAKCKGLLDRWGVCAPVGFKPSTDWAQGGPIIEREKVTLAYGDPEEDWFACVGDSRRFSDDTPDGVTKLVGPTPLIAAMRCYVASKLGGTAEVPEELT